MKKQLADGVPVGFVWLRGLPDGATRRGLLFSVAAHGVLLLALLRSPTPIFVKPSSIVAGRNGTAITQIYWMTERDDHGRDSGEGKASSPKQSKTNQRAELEWQRRALKQRTKNHVQIAKAYEDSSAQDLGGQHQAAPVGSPFGSLTYGTPFGLEVRPAYPVSGSDPVADAGELTSGFEGDVIVEVTIDEQGNIIGKTVIQGINPALDAKSLVALANWRFRPATRNGTPIASKHDVYFHFRSR